MKKGLILALLIICLPLVLPGFTACTAEPAPTEAVHWQMQTFTPRTSPIVKFLLLNWIDAVEQETDGKFTIELFDPGAVVPGAEISKAVAENVLQAGFTSPTYDVGIIPEAHMAGGLPFSFADATEALDFYYNYKDGAASKQINAAYNAKGIQLMHIGCINEPMCIMTMFPVSKVDDFQGKKIRATGGHAAGLSALGAEQFYIPLGEVYTGLQSGLADAVFMSTSGLQTFKWKEIVEYVIQPYWMFGSPMIMVANLEEWNKLPDQYKKLIQETALDINLNVCIPEGNAAREAADESAKAAGVQWSMLPPTEAAKYEKLIKDALWTEKEGLSPTNAELIGMIKEYLK